MALQTGFSVLARSCIDGKGDVIADASCLARTGMLHGSIPTPCLVIPAARGLPSFLVPSVLREYLPHVKGMGVHLAEMFLRKHLLKCMESKNGSGQCFDQTKGDVHDKHRTSLQQCAESSEEGALRKRAEPRSLFDAEGFIVHLGIRNVMQGEKETAHHVSQPHEISLEVTGSRQQLSIDAQVETVQALQPDMFTSLAEEVPSLGHVGKKRMRRSVEESHENLKLLKEKISKLYEGSNCSKVPMLFASVQGGRDLMCRKLAAQKCQEENPDGYSIGGLGYGEELDVRENILRTISRELTDFSKPRLLALGDGHPMEILQAIYMGMDFIECSFPVKAAEAGVALLFETAMPSSAKPAENTSLETFEFGQCLTSQTKTPRTSGEVEDLGKKQGRAFGKTNRKAPTSRQNWGVPHVFLWDSKYASDIRPIGSNSPVSHFSLAYIHHLLKCGEMLAQVILTVHNIHLYDRLFVESRRHISSRSLNSYVKWFFAINPATSKVDSDIHPS